VAKKLRPFLAELRPLARDARPTLRDLSRIVRRPGAANDLIELTNLQVPLRNVTTRKVNAHGKLRDGAFKASQAALMGNTPEFKFFRPYTPDLLGWFDDFSHSGVYDALGAVSRVGVHANAFALAGAAGAGQFEVVPPELRGQALEATLQRGQNNRCPGGGEHRADDGSNPFKPSSDFSCDPSQVLPGK
jgi:phospholipid/cholesterol/gamma-HCH transport system substrate-binding protein